ncbi:protein unc-50 homolog isoform X2 [Pituophis catenifer annectens]
MLPTTSINPRDQGNGSLNTRASARHTAGAKRYKYLRRLLHFRHMDFEFAVWQMLYLFTSPQKVYRNFQYRKQTKDQWARDDPAFLVLLSIWLCVSTIGFGFVLGFGFVEMIKLLLWVVFIDCVGVGLLIATLMWFISNKFLLKQQNRDYDVEWGYAFDVHLNAFYPLLVILHFIQLFFIHYVILSASSIGYFVGNTFWLIAIGYYIYVTFLGYSGSFLFPRINNCSGDVFFSESVLAFSHTRGSPSCSFLSLRQRDAVLVSTEALLPFSTAIPEEHGDPSVSICASHLAVRGLFSHWMELY